MTFKQSPVIFDEDSHSYQLDGKRLLGITGLIYSILGLGVYPEADAFVKDFVIPKAGSRGTAIHHAIQTYDQLGIRQTTQIVNTRQGDHYEDMEWDVSQEIDNYIRHLNGFEAVANELAVSDNEKYASQIDNVWRRLDTNGIWLVDTNSNNIDLYPLCGYYKSNYFNSGIDALQEYLSWQLSIYAELFEAENPGIKVEGLACNCSEKTRPPFGLSNISPRNLSRICCRLNTSSWITDRHIFTMIRLCSVLHPIFRPQLKIHSQPSFPKMSSLMLPTLWYWKKRQRKNLMRRKKRSAWLWNSTASRRGIADSSRPPTRQTVNGLFLTLPSSKKTIQTYTNNTPPRKPQRAVSLLNNYYND